MINYSFIIPHHNSPELLNRCLASIPEREDIQIIVVDDNSKEDKKPCINKQGVEVIYIDAQHTKGAGRARNVGMAKATGKWLLFADCDDTYVEEFIDVLDKFIDDDIEVLYYNYNYIEEAGISEKNTLQQMLSDYKGTIEQNDYIRFCNNPPWSKMVRHSFALQHKMYFEEVTNGNDLLFSLFVGSYVKKLSVIPNELYNYWRTKNSICSKKQTINDVLCRVNHRIKCNALYSAIGYDKWRNAIFLYALKSIRVIGLGFLVILCKAMWWEWFDKNNRYEWVNIIEKQK